MRVTQFTQYNNFVLDQQKTLSALNNVQTQIATGEKIQNMYEDPAVYTKYLKLNEELNSFTQIKSSANFAQTFANETDTTLNDFVSTLGSFKTNLLKAANDTNDDTSREAIVSELKGELEHLKDLANTSIDGKYIFSGSKFNTKPIDDNYQYQGNDAKVKAYLGAGVEREYNIDGASLFLGRDNDYSKHISTNMPQYDKMKANPQYVVRGSDGKLYIDKDIKKDKQQPDSNDNPINTPVTGDSQIRMLTGVSDIYEGNGKYKDGTSYFYVKGKKPDGTSIDAKFPLPNSDTVNDLLNKIGELYGNTATTKVVDVSLNDQGEIQVKDVQTGKMNTDFYMVASDKDEASIDDLVKNGDYIVEFQKSNYAGVPEFSSVKASNSYFDPSVYKFGTVFKEISDHENAIPQDSIESVLGDVNLTVNINGTAYSVNSSQTFQNLLDKINSAGYKASMENGEIIIHDPNSSSINQDDITISTTDSSGNSVNALSAKDSVNMDKLFMNKSANELTSNVSQIVNDYKTVIIDGNARPEKNDEAQSYATDSTTVINTMGSDKSPQTININYRDINGDLKTASITLDDNGSTFTVNGSTYHIYDAQGNETPAHDKITHETTLDTQTCQVCDKEIKQKGVTYQQLGDVVSMILSGNLPASDTPEDYQNAVAEAKNEISAGLNSKGQFYVKDLKNPSTKTDLSMYTGDGSLYFQANDAVTIDEPQVDFFGTLQKAIDAVENGNFYPDGDKDPRSFGIEGAIEAIDHVTDHVRRNHAKIGAVSNEFKLTIERTDMLKLNVQQLQSDNIDTDIGDATMRLNSLQTSYQALLASVAKINNLTLLNYL
jgi:flagellar hook-associated protein 3 FlgL